LAQRPSSPQRACQQVHLPPQDGERGRKDERSPDDPARQRVLAERRKNEQSDCRRRQRQRNA
jgi:hypothetical protein